MCVCLRVGVFMCERERERERARKKERKKERNGLRIFLLLIHRMTNGDVLFVTFIVIRTTTTWGQLSIIGLIRKICFRSKTCHKYLLSQIFPSSNSFSFKVHKIAFITKSI